jgi:orotidine-5'-phosphate decarboxylase
LTSFSDDMLLQLGFREPSAATALRLGQVAMENGADGLVCSAHELHTLATLPGVRVVPGIRPTGAAAGDQKRIATPHDAVKSGASWIVVGRPILTAADPVAAAQAVVAEMQSAP